MKSLYILSVLVFACASQVFGQSDKIVGIWLTAEGKSQVEITKGQYGKYSGKIVWLRENKDRRDSKNPDPNLRSRPMIGLQMLSDFSYDEKGQQWVNGTIYDPNNGKTYDSFMWFENDSNELHIKGFVLGMRFLGRQTLWKRESQLR